MKPAPIALEVLLDKINLLYQQAARSPGGLQGLELDLLKKYTRDWYDALLELERNPGLTANPTVPAVAQVVASRPVPTGTEAVIGGPDSFLYPSRPAVQEGSRKEDAPEIRAGYAYAPHPPRAEPDTPAPAAAVTPAPVPAVAVTPAPLPQSTAMDEPALNDRFTRPERELGQTLAARPAEDLRKLIDVNERFLFTRELFGGNSETYGQAIRRLNDLPNLNDALDFVDRELAPAHSWNMDSKVVLHLRDILEQRYR